MTIAGTGQRGPQVRILLPLPLASIRLRVRLLAMLGGGNLAVARRGPARPRIVPPSSRLDDSALPDPAPRRAGAGEVGAHTTVHGTAEASRDRALAEAERARTELRALAERTQFLAEASHAVSRSLSLDETLQAVADLAVPRLGDYCVVYLAEQEGRRAKLRAAGAGPAHQTCVAGLLKRYRPRRDHPTSRMAEAVRSGTTVRLDAIAEEHVAAMASEPGDLEFLRGFLGHAAVFVPLRVRDATLGGMLFLRAASHAGGAAVETLDVPLMEEVAQRAALAIDNARLYEASREARRRAEAAAGRTAHLQQLTAALAEAASPDDVAEIVMRFGVLPVGAYAGALAYETETEEVELRTSVGYPPEACMTAGRRWPRSVGIPLAEAIRTGEPVFVTSPADWAARYGGGYVPTAAAKPSRSQAWGALPLATIEGRRAALLWTFDAPRDFSPDDRRLMAAVTQQCAQALERARLRVAERQARAEAEAGRTVAERLATQLAQAARSIARQQTLDGVLRDITDQARTLIGAQDVTTTLGSVGDGDGATEPDALHGDVEEISAPLLGRDGRPLGVIVLRVPRGDTFTAADASILAQLAEMAAAAVENVQLYARAEQARREAEEANRAKSQFLARMSHDLRTPLNAIGGYAQLVELGVHGAVTDGQRNALTRILRAKEHLLTLINDILGFARLEAGQVQLRIQPIAVSSVFDTLRVLVEPDVMAKGIALAVLPPAPALRVAADRERLLQVLVNLTSNAVKFTDTGSITIDSEATAQEVRIRVRDTGRGIPPTLLGTIFDPFVQAGAYPGDVRGGVGLGLAISRELVRLMGGTLRAESMEGEGATFTLTLPGVAADVAPGAEESTLPHLGSAPTFVR